MYYPEYEREGSLFLPFLILAIVIVGIIVIIALPDPYHFKYSICGSSNCFQTDSYNEVNSCVISDGNKVCGSYIIKEIR